MSDRPFDRAVTDWLESGSDRTPPAAIDAVLLAVKTTPQERDLRIPWRFRQMPTYLRLAAGIAIVAVLGAGAMLYLNRGPGVGSPTPPPPTSTAAPTASPVPTTASMYDPATWVPYTSERYGYTLDHPADWAIKPSQVDWQPGAIHDELSQWPDEISDAQGGFNAPGYTIYAGRQGLETGQTPDSWTAQYISNKAAGGACGDISGDRYEPVEINGETGQRIEMVCVGTQFYTAAIVVHDGSAYLVALATLADSGNAPAVELFDAILASFRFAVDPATWVPYTSERYGYTLDHPADWTIKPSPIDWPAGAIHSEISTWPDEISDPQGGIAAGGYTIFAGRQDLEAGQTAESWTAQYISNKAGDAGGGCGDISTDAYEPVEIDGGTGQRIEMVCGGPGSAAAFYTAAIVVHDGSAYLVALATVADSGNAPAVELFDAILASFRFAAN